MKKPEDFVVPAICMSKKLATRSFRGKQADKEQHAHVQMRRHMMHLEACKLFFHSSCDRNGTIAWVCNFIEASPTYLSVHGILGSALKLHRSIYPPFRPVHLHRSLCVFAMRPELYASYKLPPRSPSTAAIEVLSMLKSLTMRFQGTCRHCRIDWGEEVARARTATLRSFDGLCIDCMDRSRPKRGDGDVDYWRQLESIDGRWDVNCRVRHGEPSWYISWCGRAEHRQKLIDRHKEMNGGVRRSGGGGRY
jgi:hypothetical protein